MVGKFKKQPFFGGFLGLVVITLFLILTYLLFPLFRSSSYFPGSLEKLRDKSSDIKKEFFSIEENLKIKKERLSTENFHGDLENLFSAFKKLVNAPDKEGAAYFNKEGHLLLWLGNVVDIGELIPTIQNAAGESHYFCLKEKASVYLILPVFLEDGGQAVFFHLLSFQPQFRTSYLKEFHFLSERLQKNCELDYWDFRDDVSGFERLFARYQDEYVGQPRLQGNIQTIFFPLRNENNSIVATVTLRSPPLSEMIAGEKDLFSFLIHGAFGLALLLLAAHLFSRTAFFQKRRFYPNALFILVLIALRAILVPLFRSPYFQHNSYFKPQTAGFVSFHNLTSSPADILFTFFFFFITVFLLFCLLQKTPPLKTRGKIITSLWFVAPLLILFSFTAIFGFHELIKRFVFNTNLNLLNPSLSASLILLHSGLLLAGLSLLVIILILLKISFILFSRRVILSIAILSVLIYAGIFWKNIPPSCLIAQAAFLLSLSFFHLFPRFHKNRISWFFPFSLLVMVLFTSLFHFSNQKKDFIFQNSLQKIVITQQSWGKFFLEDSFSEIDAEQSRIRDFFKENEPPQLANFLWKKTQLSRFNWYSKLEVLDSAGNPLSRFSLNVPDYFSPGSILPASSEWTIIQASLSFFNEEKPFLIGYKDFLENGNILGRVLLLVSLDYDIYPFLYSANPYFELLRTSSLPSLDQMEFGFAVFNRNGTPLFNPQNITTGLDKRQLNDVLKSSSGLWIEFQNGPQKLSGFFFPHQEAIYSFFYPKENIYTVTVGFLKLYVLYFLMALFLLLSGFIFVYKREIKHPFWSFSNRVYISFILIALIPIILFTLSSRSFFERLFFQKIEENTQAHAIFAQKVMEDYFFLQSEEEASSPLPDFLVSWISTAISNDVNLYQDGHLVASSRRDFFDYGILPELLNGEVYFQLRHENSPLAIQSQHIGDFSFRNLTIPYSHRDSIFLISLPFPLEREEFLEASQNLVEFLFFISIFFLLVVIFMARAFGDTIIKPIRLLLQGTEEISMGNLEVSLDYKRKDEMKNLIDRFNNMVKSLKHHQQELAEMSKKAAWADMARKVAHEIKNPLTPIQLSAEHLLRVYEDRPQDFERALEESVSYITKEVENLRRTAQDFLELAKETPLQIKSLNIKNILDEIIAPYQKILPDRIQTEISFSGQDFQFDGDKTKIKTALRNILTNAVEAISRKGSIRIKVESSNSSILLQISDTGTGIPEKVLHRVFDLYYSTKEAGTGLGLPIAKKIIDEHQGSLQIKSKENRGTSVSIEIPKKHASSLIKK